MSDAVGNATQDANYKGLYLPFYTVGTGVGEELSHVVHLLPTHSMSHEPQLACSCPAATLLELLGGPGMMQHARQMSQLNFEAMMRCRL